MAFSPDGKLLATGAWRGNGNILLWDIGAASVQPAPAGMCRSLGDSAVGRGQNCRNEMPDTDLRRKIRLAQVLIALFRLSIEERDMFAPATLTGINLHTRYELFGRRQRLNRTTGDRFARCRDSA